MVIDNAGSVGIMNTSPQAQLHLGSTTSTNVSMRIQSGFEDIASTQYVHDDAGTISGWELGTISSPDFSIEKYVDGVRTPALSILESNGNVGIGTTGPTHKLHVAGTVKIVDGTQSNGYVFTSDANGVGSWQAPAAGGETNTASNQGSGGVGVYDAKAGVDLQFRNISAEAGNEVSVTLDTKNIVLDVVEANLDLDDIGGILGTDQLANCAADQVIQQNVSGTGWTCVNPSAFDTNTTYSAGAGLNLTGTTFSIPTDGVVSSMIDDESIVTSDLANSAVTTAKILNGTILLEDLANNGCTGDQIIKRNAGNTLWECAAGPTTANLDDNFFIQGGNSFGAQATLGTNDNYALNFEVNNLTRVVIDNASVAVQRVGTGTTNASYWGHSIRNAGHDDSLVIGQSSTTYTTGGALAWVGNTSPFIYFPAGQDLKIGSGTGATPVMTMRGSNHNVGIGSASPDAKLHLGASTGLRLTSPAEDTFPTITAATRSTGGEIRASGGAVGSDYGTLIMSAGGETSISHKMSLVLKGYGVTDGAQARFMAGNTPLMTVLNSGHVGIGVTNPTTARLDVYQTTGNTAATLSRNVATTGINYCINAEASGAGATTNNAGYFAASGATNNRAILIPGGFPASGANNYAIRSESAAQSYLAGNLGIGVSAPTVSLEEACPAGFTNVKAGNNQLGCISTNVEVGGSNFTFQQASDFCFDNYGGRLLTHSEWASAYQNYAFTNENNLMWLGDLASPTEGYLWNGPLSLSTNGFAAPAPVRCIIPK